MNIGILGGTFDPIHRGHTALAQAACEKFDLGKVYFIPANVPPHKQKRALMPYAHRYAMVTLATANNKKFVPSLAEAPDDESTSSQPNYSIHTVRRFKHQMKKSDRLFFLIGIDAFLDIAKWREPEALLRNCEFIVASRPGYSLADVANSLPQSMRPAVAVTKPFQKQPARGDLVLNGATVHFLEGVHLDVSATQVREAVASGKSLARYLDSGVAEYIKKTGLYKKGRTSSAASTQA
jgi:nicotinate-nucleotide adenylyltransferase